MTEQTNPLAGLTEQEADDAIGRLQAKVDAQEEHLKAAKAHLKAMKAARRDLEPPVPLDQRGATAVEAHAEPAAITVEGGQP
jgi:multidrug resistance efflux pump